MWMFLLGMVVTIVVELGVALFFLGAFILGRSQKDVDEHTDTEQAENTTEYKWDGLK